MTTPKIGDRVRHLPSQTNPRYHLAIGTGTVVSVTDTRVRVKWDRVPNARNYKAEQLEPAEEMEACA